MPGIKPFKAYFYNKNKIKDFSEVVTPPYDVISQDQLTDLQNLSPYNFTHIDLAKEKPGDDKDNNKYTRAKKIYDGWLEKQILIQDEKPAIYFYKQEYKVLGEKHSRLGFVGLLELQDEGESKVHPHENTHDDAVDDRFQLTKTLNSSLSPIFVCYSDAQRKVEKIFNKHILSNEPMIDVKDPDGVRHRMWNFTDADVINEIHDSIVDQNLFIADGHHRFKMANELRKLKMSKKQNVTGKEPFNFVMTYFTNLDSRDLQIFPMHRIIKKIPKKLDFLEEYFRIDKIKSLNELQILLTRAGQNEHAFGLYTRDGLKLLRLKNKALIDEFVTKGSKELKSLDANILKYFIFDKIGVKSEDIAYTKNLSDLTEAVNNQAAEAGFIMNAVKINQLKAIALNGEKMPPKTTYFYPKVLSGMTVYSLE
ncbi:MAG: DUF1015 domain-containing protein [Candidatus Omnitrophica bacterium]|nr:DUF1015 domain-containing protein [Candidatus Omnitrophota bacterium]